MTGPEGGQGGAAAPARSRTPVRQFWGPYAALAGVALSAAVALTAGARPGALLLALLLAGAALVRGRSTTDGPAGTAVRSRTFDVALLVGLAVVIAALAATSAGV
jgi:hypothetical protein